MRQAAAARAEQVRGLLLQPSNSCRQLAASTDESRVVLLRPPIRGDWRGDQVMHLSHMPGHVVVCERGCLWLTFDGDPRVIVKAGQQHRCDRNAMTVEALEDASLRIR